ncbi:hypothetical protein ARMSODRAFT_949505 [Armillaria solidipes]|uniref:Uncharacterized protein n=1 Tax=Armillaria solidipes TaxID=1076256 RepID=A0A2H3CLB2_9AGAR|nr:hypothetical protein ARMSODRAFT_949505 [Armillaria solidipes]
MGYFLKLEIFARYSMKELNCTCSCSMKYISIPIEWPDTVPFEPNRAVQILGRL